VKHRDLLEAQRNQLSDHERGFIGIGGTQIEDRLRQLGVAQAGAPVSGAISGSLAFCSKGSAAMLVGVPR
jgi:hypothetical protein